MKDYNKIKAYVRQPITPTQTRTFTQIVAFKPLTIWDYKRLVEVIRLYNRSIVCYLLTGKENSGVFGDAVELFGHSPKSTITRVRPQNHCDNYIVIDGKRRKMETKTNGGQIQDLLKMNTQTINARYIHYVLDFNVRPSKKNPSGLRQLDFVCKLSHFLMRLEECKAYKPNGENVHGKIYNVQADSAKMYKAFLKDIEDMRVIPFDRKMIYAIEDFED